MHSVKEEDLELLQILRKAETLINNIKSCNSRIERQSIVEKCESELKQCKNIISRIEIETRDMETDQRGQVRQLLKERASKVKALKSDLKWAKNETNYINNYNNDDDENINIEEKYDNLDEMNEDEIMEYAQNIQQQDNEILDRVIIDVDETVKMAEATAQKVSQQTDQIERISSKLDAIDDEMERAKKILKIMLRRVITDKAVWILFGLIFIAIFILILQKAGVF